MKENNDVKVSESKFTQGVFTTNFYHILIIGVASKMTQMKSTRNKLIAYCTCTNLWYFLDKSEIMPSMLMFLLR